MLFYSLEAEVTWKVPRESRSGLPYPAWLVSSLTPDIDKERFRRLSRENTPIIEPSRRDSCAALFSELSPRPSGASSYTGERTDFSMERLPREPVTGPALPRELSHVGADPGATRDVCSAPPAGNADTGCCYSSGTPCYLTCYCACYCTCADCNVVGSPAGNDSRLLATILEPPAPSPPSADSSSYPGPLLRRSLLPPVLSYSCDKLLLLPPPKNYSN